ncbi:hypothetical protein ACFQU7_13115 [Pseudoroseomonas wenyumeiae]
MTNIPDLAIVALRRDDAGRYAVFSRADMPSGGCCPGGGSSSTPVPAGRSAAAPGWT